MAALLGFVMAIAMTVAQVICISPDVCATSDVEAATDVQAVEEVVPACDLPICGPLGARLWCIEGYESRHFGGAVNPSSGARGFLQWLPSTAHAWSVVIGDRYSEWTAAARIAAQGERFFRSQWVPLQLGLC